MARAARPGPEGPAARPVRSAGRTNSKSEVLQLLDMKQRMVDADVAALTAQFVKQIEVVSRTIKEKAVQYEATCLELKTALFELKPRLESISEPYEFSNEYDN